MNLEHEKYVRLKIGNAELVPDAHFLNPFAYCSYQAFSELSRFNKELSQSRKLITELVKVSRELRDEALLTRMSVNEVAVLATRESLERYFIETQESFREVLSNNKDLIEKLTKE